MITLQKLLSELKADSLNEIVAAGYGTPPPSGGTGSSKKSHKSSKTHKAKKPKHPKCW